MYLQQGEEKHHSAKEVTSQKAADYAVPDEWVTGRADSFTTSFNTTYQLLRLSGTERSWRTIKCNGTVKDEGALKADCTHNSRICLTTKELRTALIRHTAAYFRKLCGRIPYVGERWEKANMLCSSAFQTFLLADPSWLRKITTDPHVSLLTYSTDRVRTTGIQY